MAQTKRLTRAQKEVLVQLLTQRNPKHASPKALSALIAGDMIRRTIDGYALTVIGRAHANKCKEAMGKKGAGE